MLLTKVTIEYHYHLQYMFVCRHTFKQNVYAFGVENSFTVQSQQYFPALTHEDCDSG